MHDEATGLRQPSVQEEDGQGSELEGGGVLPQGSVRQTGACLGDCVWVYAREHVSMRL